MDETMRLEGVTAIAAILILAFAIDRIATGLLFVLSFIEGWDKRFPDPVTVADPAERVRAEKRKKLIYFVFAALLGLPLLAWYGKVRILNAVGFVSVSPTLDRFLTGLILIGGADRISELLKWGAEKGGVHASHPVEVTGKLVLEEPVGRAAGARQ